MDKRKLVIHAGMRKTGTSAIQDYLYHRLDHAETGYFAMAMPNASLLMTQAFQRGFDQLPQFRVHGWSREQVAATRAGAREQFAGVARGCSRATTVLSAEVISSFRTEELADLKQLAGRYFGEIQVVIYIRPPQSRAESVFQERLKNGFTAVSTPVPANFVGLGRNFESVFGAANVLLRPFVPQSFPARSVVADFLGLLGVPWNELPEKRVNSALSLPAVQLLYVYRKYFPQFSKLDKCLVASLFEVPGERFRMHSSLVNTVVRETPVSRDWLASRVGIDMDLEEYRDNGGIRGEDDLLALPETALCWLDGQLLECGCSPSSTRGLQGVAESLRTLGEYQYLSQSRAAAPN